MVVLVIGYDVPYTNIHCQQMHHHYHTGFFFQGVELMESSAHLLAPSKVQVKSKKEPVLLKIQTNLIHFRYHNNYNVHVKIFAANYHDVET